MTHRIGLCLALCLALGCGGKKKPADGDRKGSGSAAPAPPSGSGSADVNDGVPAGAGSGMGGSAAMVIPQTPEARGKQFEACWALWTAARFDAYANCYALDAVVEAPGSGEPAAKSRAAVLAQVTAEHAQIPDQSGTIGLELVSGQTVIAIARVTGTINGKPTGIDSGVVTDFDDQGMIRHEQAFLDAATVIGQVTGGSGVRAPATGTLAHEVVIAKGDEAEKANLETIRKLDDAYAKHDVAAYGALLADGATWSEADAAKDHSKPELLAMTQAFWKQLPDVHLEVTNTWAAGDYVAAIETITATTKGAPVSAPALAIHKLAGGKVTASWLYFQGKALGLGGAGSGT